MNDPSCVEALRAAGPDLVVVNGSPIIRQHVLDSVTARFINLHTGLTPDYRGANGGFWALANGEPERVGATVHYIDRGVDTGEIIAQVRAEIDPARDGLLTVPLLQYRATLPLLVDFVKNGAAPGPVPGSRGSKQWVTPGLGPYLKALWRPLHGRRPVVYGRPMIDHMTILVTDYRRSIKFYLQALRPLGYAMTMELDDVTYPQLPSAFFAGLGADGKPDLWLRPSTVVAPTHVAFRAESRAIVDAFYQAALAAGGTPNGPPGLRPVYDANYYAAFVLDPDGYNIEAVCRAPE